MELAQYIIAGLLGTWALYFLIKKFLIKKNPATKNRCGRGCGCESKGR
jgi:uncharacterized membrane protein YuzA (DUF378 family)